MKKPLAVCWCDKPASPPGQGTALALVGTQVNILPLVLYSKVSETGTDLPAASAASLVLVAICAVVVSIGEVVRNRRRA